MLEFKNVVKKFGEVLALDDVSFAIAPGEFVFVTGPSGAGKTTILRLLIGEFRPTSGEILFDGVDVAGIKRRDIPKLRQEIGVAFQDFKLLTDRTIRENAEVALAVKRVPKEEWEERIDNVLGLVGLRDRDGLFPSQLSGGELQRAAIARALVVNPSIIFADEPTGNLDWDTTEAIIELLDKINKEGKTVIVTTHNRQVLEKFKKREIKIKNGKLVGDTGEKKIKKAKK